MEIKKIDKSYHQELKNLIKVVAEALPKQDWLITPSEEQIETLFESELFDYWGVFEGENLLAISSLSYDEEDFADIVKFLGLEGCRVAEVAECMTLPLSRGNNFMFKINSVLVQRAKEKGIEYLIATAHPDNNASNHSLQKLGMKIKGQFYRDGKYYRNYLVMKI